MNRHLVSYDLLTPGQDYSELIRAIKRLGEAYHVLYSAWAVLTDKSCVEVRDILKQHGDLLEVYVPFHFKHGKPQGAFEVYLPYAPLASAIQADTNRLYLILLVGLATTDRADARVRSRRVDLRGRALAIGDAAAAATDALVADLVDVDVLDAIDLVVATATDAGATRRASLSSEGDAASSRGS